MMPKSTAPTDSRFASSSRITNMMIAKNKRERNIGGDDDRAAQIAEEDPLNEEHQQTAENEVVQNRVRGHFDQRAAVVIGHDLDARRQRAIAS